MSTAPNLTGVIRHLRAQSGDFPPDGVLLADYTRYRDETAFAAVVQRYGGLVLGVARRQLADRQQAEDVFQATFLALARSANRLGAQTPLANWLYTVALRQARKLRARSTRRAERERTAPPRLETTDADPLAEITGRELVQVIDEELARLPAKYRLPVLLCCVRGLSREEAAAQLGWSDGTVKGRLERGRRRLAERLAARGLAPSAIVLAPLGAVVAPPDLVARAAAVASAPWSKAIPSEIVALSATAAPRRFLPIASVACSVLVVGLGGWAIASAWKVSPNPVTAAPTRPPDADPTRDTSDPLPAGGNLRFGTSRYRQGTEITNLTVNADGKLAVAASGGHIHGRVRGFDLSDGRVVYTLGDVSPYPEAIGLSPDNKTLAVKASNSIHLFEAATGKELRKITLTDTRGGTLTYWITFTPDGKAIALTQGEGSEVLLVDLEKGAVAQTFKHDSTIFAAAFSPDGQRMAAGGYDYEKGMYFARLWEVGTGKELRRLNHRGWLRTLAFSPDGKSLASGGDGGWATLWEVETGKELHTFLKGGYRVRSVAFSPDGKSLAVAGDTIRLFDPTTRKMQFQIDRQAMGLRFSADSKVLAGAVTGTIHRWDAATGKSLIPEAACESAVDQVLVTPDARQLVTRGQDGDVHVWDARTGAHIRRIAGTWQRGMALSPDGRFLVWPMADEKVKFKDPNFQNAIHTGNRLRLYDLTSDQFIDRFPGFEGDAQRLAFTPDGSTLVTVDHRDGAVRLWDVATGKEQRKFRAVREDEKGTNHSITDAVLSPDCKTLAVAYQPRGTGFFSPFAVRLWDVATGTERHELTGHFYYVGMAFTPDSRHVVTCSQALNRFAQEQLKRPANQLFAWDVATGKRIAPLPDGLPTGAEGAAFAPDGRTLATVTPDGLIQLWETATWTVRAEYRGHRDRVNSLTFAADGRLFTGGLDTTVLAWELRPPKSVGTVDAAWDTLAKSDGAAAFKAQGTLIAAPTDAIKLITAKVKRVDPPDPKRLAQFVAELDSPDFATRERASKGLADIGQPALGPLREAARKSTSTEVQKRATDLIDQIERPRYWPDELRAMRAVEVLEWIGTPEAREILTGLAKGEPSATTTSAANAAIKRLKVRDALK